MGERLRRMPILPQHMAPFPGYKSGPALNRCTEVDDSRSVGRLYRPGLEFSFLACNVRKPFKIQGLVFFKLNIAYCLRTLYNSNTDVM